MGSALGLLMLCSVLIGPLIAMWAGVRRGNKIDQLIHKHEMALDVQMMLEQPESYERAIRTRAPGLMTRADLDELLPLVRQTRGAPGYDWLTVAWVEEQLAALPSLEQMAALTNSEVRRT